MDDAPVRIYASGNAFDGQLTKGRLEAEGIVVMMKGEGEGPYRTGPVYLWVAAEDAARAREIVDAIAAGDYATPDDAAIGGDVIANEQPVDGVGR